MHTDWGHSRAGGCSHKHPINCLSWPRWQWRRRRRSNSHERSSQNTEYERVNDGWLQPQKTLERPNQGCGVMFPERASSQHGASHPRPTSPGGSSQSGGKVPSQDVGNSCLAWIGAHLQRRGPALGQGSFECCIAFHFPVFVHCRTVTDWVHSMFFVQTISDNVCCTVRRGVAQG